MSLLAPVSTSPWWTRVVGRLDLLLTRRRLRVYPAVVIGLFVVVWLASLAVTVALPDFLARWTAGRMLLDGQVDVLYDPGVQSSLQEAVGATRLSWFVSPPYVALLFAPFGALPYPVAALLWTGFTVLVLAWCARSLSRLDPRLTVLGRPGGVLLVASCQPVLELVGAGQDTALVLAALTGGAVLLHRGRDVGAGVVLAAGLVKPHLVVLVPVVVLLARRWRVVLGFAALGGVIAGLTTVLLGSGAWSDWLDALSSPLYASEVGQGQSWKNAGLNGLVGYLLGPLPGWVPTLVWGALSMLVLWLTARRVPWRRVPPWVLVLVVVPLTTVVVGPHVLVYDLVVALPAVVLVVGQGSATDRVLALVGYVLLFLAPLLHLIALQLSWLAVVGAPWVCLVSLALWWRGAGSRSSPVLTSASPTR